MASSRLSASPLRKPASPSPSTPLQQEKRRDAVYVAAVPLRASRGPARMLMSTAYSVGLWDLQHFMVIIKPTTSPSQVTVFDFQPQDPENIYVALAVLSQRKVPGVVRKRIIGKLPKNRCWLVGLCSTNGVDVSNKFSKEWPRDLIVGEHDCRHYTNGLVEHLTGKQQIVETLRATSSS